MITREQITGDLKALDIRTGDAVMMHSSLSALGFVDGGAETVVDALLETVGPDGTLLVPAFRDSAPGHCVAVIPPIHGSRWGQPPRIC